MRLVLVFCLPVILFVFAACSNNDPQPSPPAVVADPPTPVAATPSPDPTPGVVSNHVVTPQVSAQTRQPEPTAAVRSTPEPSLTIEPSPTPVPTKPAPPLDMVQFIAEFAQEHPTRASGSAEEKAAAAFLEGYFRELGYHPEVFQFRVFRPESGFSVEGGDIDSNPMLHSALGRVSGQLAWAGLGRPEETPQGSLEGKIAVMERGEITFAEKINNAAAAGAIGAVISNNGPGIFSGVAEGGQIPAISISRQEGRKIFSLLISRTRVNGEFRTSYESFLSQNVVARKPGPEGADRLVFGAHYDTAAQATDPNDNGSGVAVLLALAQRLRDESLPHPVELVAFGSLMSRQCFCGSENYLRALGEDTGIAAMVNFDAMGIGTTLELAGPQELRDAATGAAEAIGADYEPLEEVRYWVSDNVTFLDAGIPALWIHSQHDSNGERLGPPSVDDINSDLLDWTLEVSAELAQMDWAR